MQLKNQATSTEQPIVEVAMTVLWECPESEQLLIPVTACSYVAHRNQRLGMVSMPQTPSGCSAVELCRFRWAHFRYEASRTGDHAAVATRTRTRSTPDLNRVRLLSQIPSMLRKQRKGNVPDTGGDIHKAKRRAADIDDAVLQLGKWPRCVRFLAGPPP